ncbi:VOC family protein [Stackebrandtia nassauensis]|uniref:Glyoxalase/bleomycin resistance protein/dioxygenase n=1 Tax=Stackebrandtia nassauensis (strain DSM 44728 / CIP 108903 / NRRL B-16338 / NBRC 102104 / LLR-40K-21) TaxID=446470 RepID=D3Q2X8_STANL|nr:VOC family protein [Stackebrandtia nassauensis]ADD39948.1 Glyoxalase/bleomycin resistance protein/dioxygenase [Stackebrandtia nassauensis DSM 44728]
MSIMIFPNLPVKDLEAAKKFYTALGFELNKDFSDDNAASIVIAENIVVMLLREEFFSTFDSRTIADTATTVESVHALGVESRGKVDELVDAAIAAGGKEAGEAKDEGFMYGRAFFDLDGHHWEVMFMDLSAMPQE